jgi:hypothetical protein
MTPPVKAFWTKWSNRYTFLIDMKRFFYFSAILLLFAAPAALTAASSIPYNGIVDGIKVVIVPDYKATGVWPINAGVQLGDVASFQNFGATGLMSYVIQKIENNSGTLYELGVTNNVDIDSLFLGSANSQYATLTYDVYSAITKPVAIYEFWVPGGAARVAQKGSVTFPTGWNLLTSWPSGTVTGNTITFDLLGGSSNPYPIMVMLQPPVIDPGYTIQTFGPYTVIGRTADVQKIGTAVNHMTYLNDLFTSTLGVTPPQKMIIYVGDLSGANVGYEASALAAKPNLILYNQDILQRQDREEVETDLVHETAHLTEMSQNHFGGGIFDAPWFLEGIADIVENQARGKILRGPDLGPYNRPIPLRHPERRPGAGRLCRSAERREYREPAALCLFHLHAFSRRGDVAVTGG